MKEKRGKKEEEEEEEEEEEKMMWCDKEESEEKRRRKQAYKSPTILTRFFPECNEDNLIILKDCVIGRKWWGWDSFPC